jgi:DNA-binding NarL/FixJ family response regulator
MVRKDHGDGADPFGVSRARGGILHWWAPWMVPGLPPENSMSDIAKRRRLARRARAAANDPATIRIVIADHQAIDRAGMVGLLDTEPDFEVVGEAASVDEAIQQCGSLTPDVLVVALNLAGNTEKPALPQFRAKLPQLRVLALSERGHESCLVLNPPGSERLPEQVREWLCSDGWDCLQTAAQQGALGTLRRSSDPEELFRAVRAVGRGNVYYDATTVQRMMHHSSLVQLSGSGAPRDDAAGEPLTDRERDVAALIAAGRSNKEIATDLGISEPTVKKHVGKVLEKLGTQDRLQAGLRIARHPQLLRRES